jgi:DNA-directed RNA polymerase specialized sigma24 family protein
LFVLTQEALREESGLTQIAFTRLLAWLDDGVDSNGERYLEMRRRLVSYFDRRSRLAADELADETLTRVGRTLEQTGAIATRPPARYCYVVAKFVLLEDIRRERKHVPFDGSKVAVAGGVASGLWLRPDEGYALRERRLDCLDRCLQKLEPAQRELIVEYYADDRHRKIERRRNLAINLGITMNALGIRAFRIRDRLMACVEDCRRCRRKI